MYAVIMSAILIVATFVLGGCATSYNTLNIPVSDLIQVACVGDSITYGSGLKNREQECYPAVLANKLGDGWVVENFGVPGIRAVNYAKTDSFRGLKKVKPAIVVIMLGVNDAAYWQSEEIFREKVEEMILGLRDISNYEPRILLCLPYVPPGREKRMRSINLCLTDIGRSLQVQVVKINKRFSGKDHLLDESNLHCSARGCRILADEVYRAITGRRASFIDHVRQFGEKVY